MTLASVRGRVNHLPPGGPSPSPYPSPSVSAVSAATPAAHLRRSRRGVLELAGKITILGFRRVQATAPSGLSEGRVGGGARNRCYRRRGMPAVRVTGGRRPGRSPLVASLETPAGRRCYLSRVGGRAGRKNPPAARGGSDAEQDRLISARSEFDFVRPVGPLSAAGSRNRARNSHPRPSRASL